MLFHNPVEIVGLITLVAVALIGTALVSYIAFVTRKKT